MTFQERTVEFMRKFTNKFLYYNNNVVLLLLLLLFLSMLTKPHLIRDI